MGLVDDRTQGLVVAHQRIDLAQLGKEVERLPGQSDAQRLAERIGLAVRGAIERRPAGRGEDRTRLAGQERAGFAFAGAPGPRLVVIGSTKFWGQDSARICEAIAVDLAAIDELVAVTGGVAGVGQTFGQVFSATRNAMSKPENLYHLLPRGLEPCDSGITIGAGDDFFERREILGRLGQIYLMIEGGPGTQHEAEVAVSKGFPVIPAARPGAMPVSFSGMAISRRESGRRTGERWPKPQPRSATLSARCGISCERS